MNDELKDIEFGEIKNIELITNWNLDPLMGLVYDEIAGDMREWKDLYMKGDQSRLWRQLNFPQAIEIKVHYDHYIQSWECFQTEEWITEKNTEKLKCYENLVKLWRSTPIQTVQVTPRQENWAKEIFGLKFCIASLQYLEGSDK